MSQDVAALPTAHHRSVKGIIQVEDARQESDSFANIMPDTMQADDPQRHSGVASNMLQKAGMVELGSFIKYYRNWKLRVYRAVWNIIRTTWTNERWRRVDAGNPALPQTTLLANHGTSVSSGYFDTSISP